MPPLRRALVLYKLVLGLIGPVLNNLLGVGLPYAGHTRPAPLRSPSRRGARALAQPEARSSKTPGLRALASTGARSAPRGYLRARRQSCSRSSGSLAGPRRPARPLLGASRGRPRGGAARRDSGEASSPHQRDDAAGVRSRHTGPG